MALNKENEWEEKLPELPAYQKYSEFNNEKNITADKGVCNKLGDVDDDTMTFCKKTAIILRGLSTIQDRDLRSERCNYFQNWFYDQIRKKFTTNGNHFNKSDIVTKLFNIVNEVNSKDLGSAKCMCYFIGEAESWKEEKDLHDYFKNHSDIKCEDMDKDRCQMYQDYVAYISRIYEKQNDENGCCDYGILFQECEHYMKCEVELNPSVLLTKLKEQHEQLKRKNIGDTRVSRGVSANSDISQLENGILFPLGSKINASGREGIEKSSQCTVSSNQGTLQQCEDTALDSTAAVRAGLYSKDNLSLGGNQIPHIDSTSEYGLHERVGNSYSVLEMTYSILDSNYFRYGLSVAAIIGTILFFFVYFKFTSSRHSSRKKARKKKKYENYFSEDEKELLTDDLESIYIYTQSNRLYVAYHAR
ncbi:PIR Superfamily Protein [Plasmodium ovale wallikeri]|uniref:PIR Superfamily Protein n=2 Tax=Plasmodium ovale TaxID=36330 RepID=A0A1A8YI61_PLAOA|nr:PIR Superfamily Protein [Plasmodium ovale wallikeri]SBT31549.1 PIR Superfamily Protein [Plasmodium ovale wallikeri]SBT74231.1 PIR protein [Plasmodium ovale]